MPLVYQPSGHQTDFLSWSGQVDSFKDLASLWKTQKFPIPDSTKISITSLHIPLDFSVQCKAGKASNVRTCLQKNCLQVLNYQ